MDSIRNYFFYLPLPMQKNLQLTTQLIYRSQTKCYLIYLLDRRKSDNKYINSDELTSKNSYRKSRFQYTLVIRYTSE